MTDFLEKANGRLKSAKCRVHIEQQGNSLYLRGTFPCPLGTNQRKQRRIALNVKATPEGVRFAESKAKELSAKLDLKSFDWKEINGDRTDRSDRLDLSSLTTLLEKEYFQERSKTPTTIETWNREYLSPISKLSGTITLDYLRECLFKLTEPDTRNRRRYALAYARLADLAELDGDSLRALVGDYGLKSLTPRSLPDDALIQSVYQSLSGDDWLAACFCLMAAWGLRNHECFFADLEEFPICFVARGKRDERYCWPLYPEWAEWIKPYQIPQGNEALTNSQLGNKITKAFSRHHFPFKPYDLRHAWAVRSISFGLDISLAAAQMGHSVAVHSRIYHHWITKETHQRAYNIIISNPNRPLPPI